MNLTTLTPSVHLNSPRGPLTLETAPALFLDRPLPASAALRLPRRLAGVLPFADAGAERADAVAMLGLAALIVPAVAYSFAQLGSLVSGGALLQAIHALLP